MVTDQKGRPKRDDTEIQMNCENKKETRNNTLAKAREIPTESFSQAIVTLPIAGNRNMSLVLVHLQGDLR